MPCVEGETSSLRVNLCHIVPSLETRHGGPSKSVPGLSLALTQLGNSVELLTTDPTEDWKVEEAGLNIRAFRRGWPQSFCTSPGLRRYLGSVKADIIHHHSIWLRTLHYAHCAARRTSAQLVISPRGMMDPWAWKHHSTRKAFARRFIHPGALEDVAGWHATSGAEASAITDLGFHQPVCVAPNGVSAPTYPEIARAREHWRRILPTSAGRPVALFYSRFHQKKRLIELIDAWFEFGPKDWLLLIVGIPEEYSPRSIEGYVQRAGQAGRVRAFDGSGHPPPYAVASLFLLPSHGENFGLSIAEALAWGVPAVVTDTTPWSGLNTTGSGWCVPWSDFGSAIRTATSESAESLNSRGKIGSDWVLREFSWKKAARTLSDFYRTLRP